MQAKVLKTNDSRHPRNQHQPKARDFDLNHLFGDKRVVVVMKGREIITGIWDCLSGGFVKISDCTIKGQVYETQVPFVVIERNAIAHVHDEAELKPISEGA